MFPIHRRPGEGSVLGTGQRHLGRMGPGTLARAAALLSPLLLCSGECGNGPAGSALSVRAAAGLAAEIQQGGRCLCALLLGVQAFQTQWRAEAMGTLPAGFECAEPSLVGVVVWRSPLLSGWVVIWQSPRLLGSLFGRAPACRGGWSFGRAQ